MKYFLGIDGGGTKTHAVVIDENYNIVYEDKFDGTHIITAGDDRFREIMTTIYSKALEVTSNNLDHIFCARAGYGEFKNDNDKIEQILSEVFTNVDFKVLNDSVGVWAGGLLCENGIGVIAGTGSCCCGIIDGEYIRVGGWGYIAGDEASAYWISTKLVNSYMRMIDGRMNKTVLVDVMDKEFDLNEENNALNLIYRTMDCKRPEIAQIAKVCSIAAEKGCEVSYGILKDAAYELFEHINTTAKKMNTTTMIPVTYTGGVFLSTIFKKELINYMNEANNNYTLVEPITNAAFGSAIYASVLSGKSLTSESREAIKTLIK